jgi:hypothetical protein
MNKKIILILLLNINLNSTNPVETNGFTSSIVNLGLKKNISFINAFKIKAIENNNQNFTYSVYDMFTEEKQTKIKEDLEKLQDKEYNFNKKDYYDTGIFIKSMLMHSKEYKKEFENFQDIFTVDKNNNNCLLKSTKFKASDKEIVLVTTDDKIKITINDNCINIENKDKNKNCLLNFSNSKEEEKKLHAASDVLIKTSINNKISKEAEKAILDFVGDEYGIKIIDSSNKVYEFFRKHEGKFAIGGAVSTVVLSLVLAKNIIKTTFNKLFSRNK